MTTATISVPNPANATSAINSALSGSNSCLILPSNAYTVTQIDVPNHKTLQGEGNQPGRGAYGGPVITGAISFDSGAEYSAIEGLRFAGPSVTYSGLKVRANNVACVVRDVYIMGGVAALDSSGADNYFKNCYFGNPQSSHGAVENTGANWWLGCHIDSSSLSGTTFGFLQGNTPASVIAENHLICTTIRGGYSYGVYLDDQRAGGPFCVVSFSNCTIKDACVINHSKWTSFEGCEVGAVTNNNGDPVTVIGCIRAGGMSLTGSNITNGCNF